MIESSALFTGPGVVSLRSPTPVHSPGASHRHASEHSRPRGKQFHAHASRLTDLAVPVSHLDHTLGDQAAPVVLVQYGDYSCPTCADTRPLIEGMIKRFGGGIAFVYRHFPILGTQAFSQLAAEAAEAAACNGLFWEMHHRLLQSQNIPDRAFLSWHAATLSMDVLRFEHELNTHAHAPRVASHVAGAKRASVAQTPAFFINGMRFNGRLDAGSLPLAIKRELAHFHHVRG